MKAIRLFSMATLALLMAACSTDEIEQAPQQPVKTEGVIEFTGTISGSGTTRTTITEGTGEDAGKLLVAWNLYDEVHLFQGATEYGTAQVTYVDDAGVATIKGTLTTEGYDLADPFTIKYFGNATSEAWLKTFLQNQRGTIGKLADYDWREGAGQLVLDTETNKYVLSNKVTMASKMAIWRLTLKDHDSNALNLSQTANQLCVFIGGEKVGTGDEFIGGSTNVVYLAVPAVSDASLSILYTMGTDKYLYTKSGVTLAASTYYQSVVDMGDKVTNLVELTPTTGEVTVNNGDVLIGTGGTDTHVTIAAGASVTLQDVDITSIINDWSGITCAGNATINLVGTNKVMSGGIDWSGIFIPDGFTLTIDGTGNLEARGCEGAGIGGGYGKTGGNIIINGGTITASSIIGAGIGSGNNGDCGDITINGGTITADNHEEVNNNSAGIGSGFQGTCGNITITGGTVTAISCVAGACIGSGLKGTCGNISISGSSTAVNALGSEEYSTGIGAGESATCGTITIEGGNIQAKGGEFAAGIGTSGYDSGYDTQHSTCGAISITGGNVVAFAGNSALAAIGIAEDSSVCPSILISNGITALEMKNATAQSLTNFGTYCFWDLIRSTGMYVYLNNTETLVYNNSATVENPELLSELDAAGFKTTYDSSAKTWKLEHK